MTEQSKGKHLTISDRLEIERCIHSGMLKIDIAKKLRKDKSTIGKEINSNRVPYCSKFSYPIDCIKFPTCSKRGTCKEPCSNFVQFKCKRRDISPGACNGCSKLSHCRFMKITYNALNADHNYKIKLRNSREGYNLTVEEINFIGNIVAPLLKKGQSPYHICKNHPEIGIVERTLYNYIEAGVFKDFDIDSFSLRRQVSRKPTKKKKETKLKKRQDRFILSVENTKII